MCLGEGRASLVKQLFESAAAQVAKQDPRRAPGVLREFALRFRVGVTGYPEQVGEAVVVEVYDAGAPTDVSRLNRQARTDRDISKSDLAAVDVQGDCVGGEGRLEQVEAENGRASGKEKGVVS